MITARATIALLPYVCIILTAIILSFFSDIQSIWTAIEKYPPGKTLLVLSQIFFAVHISVFIWRIVLCMKYKPTAPCTDDELPTCTVIVPAYNEGRQVFDTITSIVQSDYPSEKMNIFAIDDGSSDDTWYWLNQAEKEFPDRVQLFKQPVNKGKRHALYMGFKQGQGDVYVTIDSDSIVEPQTIRHLVSPFVRNHRVGAVAGNVRILNHKAGMIPKMLDVSFAFSFDFLRAGQSVINSVMCTPGALSAYRREVVLNVLFEWLNQKFFGRPANIGEDRAMTNLILRNGYHVRYERDAVVHTTCPVTFVKLWKMFLRWARSNIRETIVITRFVFRKFRNDGALGLRINVLINLMNMTFGQVMRISAVALLVCIPLSVAPNLILGAAMAACAPGIFYAIRYKSHKALWSIPYSFFWMAGLSWISTYALMTPHKNGWMTRDLETETTAPWPSSPDKEPFAVPHHLQKAA